MSVSYILLTGIKDPDWLCDHFGSHFVDIAYAEKLTAGNVKIIAENEAWLQNDKDKAWLLSLIRETLATHQEDECRAEIVLAPG